MTDPVLAAAKAMGEFEHCDSEQNRPYYADLFSVGLAAYKEADSAEPVVVSGRES